MNLPNKLSICRAVCIPIFVILLYFSSDGCRIAAGIVFILASLTDFLDGHIARKNNLITDFGKFIDPVADKLLVISSLIMMIHMNLIDAWIVILVLCREFAVDGLRLVAVTKGTVIAAGKLGKYKTTCQMVLISICILLNIPCFSAWYTVILTSLMIILTVFSGIDYFVRNRAVFQTG